MAKRIVHKTENHRVKYDSDWQEYTIYHKDSPHETTHDSDKQSAIDTCNFMEKRLESANA